MVHPSQARSRTAWRLAPATGPKGSVQGRVIRLNQIMRGWANYFRHAVCKHTLGSLERFTWHRVIRWWQHLRRWNWRDVHRHLTGPQGRWRRPAVDGIELFDIASIPVTRYRYRGNKIHNPWPLSNPAYR